MRIIFMILVLATPLATFAKEEKGQNFGLGLSLFGPTGITGKYRLDEKKSIEGSLGIGFLEYGRFHFHGVFLYNFHEIQQGLNLYTGGGLVLQERIYTYNRRFGIGRGRRFWGTYIDYEMSMGLRAPLGISWFASPQFEFSAEVFLQLFLSGKTGGDLGLALAGRYYF